MIFFEVCCLIVACAQLIAGSPFATLSQSSYPDHDDHQQQELKTYDIHGPQQNEPDDDAGAAPVTYHFQYAVNDPATGDVKSQNEVSDGRGGVRGTYSLIEPDGSIRVVEYAADDVHGFTADVKKIGPQHKASGAEETAGFDIAKSAELYYSDREQFVPVGTDKTDVDGSEPYSPR